MLGQGRRSRTNWENLENWRPPAKEHVFRPVPIGARPTDCRAYRDAPRPLLQPLGASHSPQEASTRSTLEAAADKLAASEDPVKARASSELRGSTRSLKPPSASSHQCSCPGLTPRATPRTSQKS